MKTLWIVTLSVAAGGLGAYLFIRHCQKKKKCGCGGDCSGSSTSAAIAPTTNTSAPPLATPGILPEGQADVLKPLAFTGENKIPQSLAADGFVKQPRTW